MAVLWCLASYWAFWEYRDVSWTLPRLVLLLSTPALIYVFSSLVVPTDPASVTSWREYFFGVRVRLFSAGAFLVASVLLSNQFLLEVHALHYTQLQLYGILAALLAGAAASAPRFHAILAILPWASGVSILLGNFGEPNWVSP